MALIERLMGLEDPKILVHEFFASQSEVALGFRTVQQVKTYFGMDAASQAEYDALIALAPTGSTTAARLNRNDYINSMHAVFILAETGATFYTTPALVRSRLGI
jgi:hypothetical protein